MFTALLFLAQPVLAHDIYLAATPVQVAPGERATVHGMVAWGKNREKRTSRPETLARLDALVDGKATALVGCPTEEGQSTCWGIVPTASAGVVPVVYTNQGAEVTLPHERFVNYVRAEGDDRMITTAEKLEGDQLEHYRRSLKALVRVGDASKGWDTVTGLPLELVPTADPFARPASGALPLRLLADGKPLANVKVRAFPEGGDAQLDAVEGRTDEKGRVELQMPARDEGWVVASVIMTYEPDRKEPWHSTWTSLRVP